MNQPPTCVSERRRKDCREIEFGCYYWVYIYTEIDGVAARVIFSSQSCIFGIFNIWFCFPFLQYVWKADIVKLNTPPTQPFSITTDIRAHVDCEIQSDDAPNSHSNVDTIFELNFFLLFFDKGRLFIGMVDSSIPLTSAFSEFTIFGWFVWNSHRTRYIIRPKKRKTKK